MVNIVFELYPRRGRLLRRRQTWGWRLWSQSDIIATDGGQGYDNMDEALERGTAVIRGHYHNATVVKLGDNGDRLPLRAQ